MIVTNPTQILSGAFTIVVAVPEALGVSTSSETRLDRIIAILDERLPRPAV
jgi:hypothetical protein